jgi:hypothetical protein
MEQTAIVFEEARTFATVADLLVATTGAGGCGAINRRFLLRPSEPAALRLARRFIVR